MILFFANFAGTMYFSCLCKKRYQKKQPSVPLERFKP